VFSLKELEYQVKAETMKISTAQLGKHQCIDTTVKSGTSRFGKLLAPTWELVGGVKNFECNGSDSRWTKHTALSHDQYTEGYIKLLTTRFNSDPTPFLVLAETDKLTVGCYCRPGDFCHRLLVTDVFTRIVALCKRIASEPELETKMRVRLAKNDSSTVNVIIEQMKRVALVKVEYMGEVGQPTPPSPTVPAQETSNITEVKGDLLTDKQTAILQFQCPVGR